MLTEENSEVHMIGSSAKETYSMPDVIGINYEQAVAMIECMDVSVEVTEGSCEGLPEGTVISQSIQPFTDIKSGGSVVLIVTAGVSQTAK